MAGKAKGKKNAVAKPFLKGAPTDETSVRRMAGFFGIMLLTGFMTFIVCSMTSFQSVFLRILVNAAIVALILLIYASKGTEYGTEGVAKGEILYQHTEKGMEITPGERRIPYHPLKGFIIGFGGSSVLFLLALILAFTSEKQMTGAGTLPSWMDSFMRRSEISGALTAYTQSASLSFTDILRIAVRLLIMPFVSMAGTDNKDTLLLMERLSPLILLLPAAAYGTGYLRGPSVRAGVHTEIAANNRKRISREKKERRARAERNQKGPEQLN